MKRLRRLLTIIRVFHRYRLDQLLPQVALPLPLRALIALLPQSSHAELSRGARLRLALEALGPIFVKFGQLLSTRRDLMPVDIADELALLQDSVAPFSSSVARDIIERELSCSVDEIFAEFSLDPMASASVAQVHAARLKTGEDVVVKVVRPGIENIISSDMQLLYSLARLAQKYLPDGKRLRPVEVVEDYEHTIFDELDLQREAANTSQLRRNFEHSDLLYIPTVYWDYTRHKVMVVERIYGIPVTDLGELEAQNTNMRLLAERGVEIFFTQVFRDNFFHADMHPGNIFVSREHPENPQYIGIDCAIIGSLTDFDRYYLARNLLAIFHRDYHLVAELHVECGWVPAHTKPHEFEAAIRSVCEPVFEKPLGEISFGQLLVYLFRTARRFEMEVQPSLVLLQKTLLNIEGLGRELYPQLDLWQTAKPFLEEWVRERYSAQSMRKVIEQRAPGWLEQLPALPDLLLSRLAGETADQRRQREKLQQLEAALKHTRRRRENWTMAAGGLAGVYILNSGLSVGGLFVSAHPATWLIIGFCAAWMIRR